MGEIHNQIIEKFNNKINPIILDIGSYDLSDSILFHDIFPSANIHAFECDPRNIQVIKENDWHNKYKIILWEFAVGCKDGTIDFWPSEKINFNSEWHLSGSIRKPYKHLEEYTVSFGQPITIESKRLDTWYKNSSIYNQMIEFIWIDGNGSEIDIIQGGEECLKNVHLLWIELFEKEMYLGQLCKQFVEKLLKTMGFEYAGLSHGHNYLYERKI